MNLRRSLKKKLSAVWGNSAPENPDCNFLRLRYNDSSPLENHHCARQQKNGTHWAQQYSDSDLSVLVVDLPREIIQLFLLQGPSNWLSTRLSATFFRWDLDILYCVATAISDLFPTFLFDYSNSDLLVQDTVTCASTFYILLSASTCSVYTHRAIRQALWTEDLDQVNYNLIRKRMIAGMVLKSRAEC